MLALGLACVLATGCGGEGGAGPRGAAAITAPVTALRADLAAGLDERAWLTTLTARTTLLTGDGSPAAAAARAALDKRSVALAGRISREPTALVTLLRRQDDLWAQRARTTASGKAGAREAVRVGLNGNRAAIARLLAVGSLSATGLEADLAPGYRSLALAVDAVARGRADAPSATATAATRSTRVALPLTSAAKRRRPGLAGRPASPAAELATLAAVGFTDHAYALTFTDALLAAGARPGGRLQVATATLSGTTAALERLVTSVYGDDLGGRFGTTWDRLGTAFGGYATAKATKDTAGAARALAALDRFARETAALFDEADPTGARPALVAALAGYVDATTATIRAQATGSPLAAPRILASATAGREVGRELALRAARQFPDTFRAE